MDKTPTEAMSYEPGSDQDPRLSALRLITLQAQAARKLLKILRKPEEWCPMGKAVDHQGKQVRPLSANATHWSLLGTLYRCRLNESEVMALRVFFEGGQGWTIESVSNSMPRQEQVKVLQGLAKDCGEKEQALEDYQMLAQAYRDKKFRDNLAQLKLKPQSAHPRIPQHNPSNAATDLSNETPTPGNVDQSQTTTTPEPLG